jgi:L-lactate dehydrogenase (cytochrome)
MILQLTHVQSNHGGRQLN